VLTRSELEVNPVVMEIVTSDGTRRSIKAERIRGNRLAISCTCEDCRREGWCREQIDLLCLRYERVVDAEPDSELRFEDLVVGTALADLADEVDLALSDYETATAALENARTRDLTRTSLQRTADLASQLAEAARQLDGAIARFKRKLASPEA
jgi:hypothetical protein